LIKGETFRVKSIREEERTFRRSKRGGSSAAIFEASGWVKNVASGRKEAITEKEKPVYLVRQKDQGERDPYLEKKKGRETTPLFMDSHDF